MRFGSWDQAVGRAFKGSLDDIRIYNVILSEARIRERVSEGLAHITLLVHGGNPRSKNSMRSPASKMPSRTIYEDAEDKTIGGWQVYGEGSVVNMEDSSGNRIISTEALLIGDPFRLGLDDESDWNNTEEFTAYFAVLMEEDAAVYFRVGTADGEKYLCYTAGAETITVNDGVICFGLGIEPDGQWHTITRNLVSDLGSAIPGAKLLIVKDFYVFGSAKLDDVMLLNFGR